MASATLQGGSRYPVGTSVGAYLERYRNPSGGAPTGPAVETEAVASNGQLTFSSLAAGTNYVAYAQVSGEHRYVGISAPSDTGLDSATFWASDTEVQSALAAARSVGGDALLASPPSGDTTGVTDSAAIQRLIDQLAAAKGGTVELRHAQLDAPYYCTLTLKTGVRLKGQGTAGTTLKKPAGSSSPVIGTSGDSAIARTMMLTGVSALRVDGNKQGGATGDGIYIAPSLNQIDMQTYGLYDTQPYVIDVLVMYCLQDGISLPLGPSSARVRDCFSYANDRYNYNIGAYDADVSNCQSGVSGSHGFFINSPSCFVKGCKAFFAGYKRNGIQVDGTNTVIFPNPGEDTDLSPGAADGFYVNGQRNQHLVGCQSQDNGRYGFHVVDGTSVRIAGAISADDVVASVCLTTSTGCEVDFQSQKGDRSTTPTHVIFDGASTTINEVRVSFDPANGPTQVFSLANGATMHQNCVRWGYTKGVRVIQNADPASVPVYPWQGETTLIPLNVNRSIQDVVSGGFCTPGQRVTLVFTQDGTGGRTVTWGANWVNPPLIDTAANAVTTVTFVNKTVDNGTPVMVHAEPSGNGLWTQTIEPWADPATQTNFSTLLTNTAFMRNPLLTSSGAQNATIGWDVALDAGTWEVKVWHSKFSDRGIYTVALAGSTLGTIDGYNAGAVDSGDTLSATVTTAGKKRLAITMATKNASSSSYLGALYLIALRRTA